jgi:putative methionine-R-sulfoxide reductase with GAF domain
MIVSDVTDLGDDYVACDPRDRSEIVIPIHADLPAGEKIDRVLDLDSVQLDLFSDLDDRHLRAALRLAGFKPAGDLLTAPGE